MRLYYSGKRKFYSKTPIIFLNECQYECLKKPQSNVRPWHYIFFNCSEQLFFLHICIDMGAITVVELKRLFDVNETAHLSAFKQIK